MKPILITKNNFEDNFKEDIFSLKKSLYFFNYHVINDHYGFQILLIKRKFDILIQIANYEIYLNEKELSELTSLNINSINEAFIFIIYTFENKNYTIKNIIPKKSIILLMTESIFNEEKHVEITMNYIENNNENVMNDFGYDKYQTNNSIKNTDKIYIEKINNFQLFSKKVIEDNENMRNNIFNNINMTPKEEIKNEYEVRVNKSSNQINDVNNNHEKSNVADSGFLLFNCYCFHDDNDNDIYNNANAIFDGYDEFLDSKQKH